MSLVHQLVADNDKGIGSDAELAPERVVHRGGEKDEQADEGAEERDHPDKDAAAVEYEEPGHRDGQGGAGDLHDERSFHRRSVNENSTLHQYGVRIDNLDIER